VNPPASNGTKARFTEIHPGVFRLALPLPGKKPGPVNVYLFLGQNKTLLDTGSSRTVHILETALENHGLKFQDLDRLVITHGHLDHYGAARKILSAPGSRCRLAAHPGDLFRIRTGLEAPVRHSFAFLRLMGVPPALSASLLSIFVVFKTMAQSVEPDWLLNEGDTLLLGDCRCRVIHTPGHTRGSVSFHLPDQSLLFSGDHILGHITPNALVMFERRQSLPKRSPQDEFYASIQKVEALAPRCVHPGHGGPMEDIFEVTDMYRRTFTDRQRKILALVQEGGMSVHDMARALFVQNLRGKRYPLELYLAVSEVYTHVQALETLGFIHTRIKGGRLLVKPSPQSANPEHLK
jgi:glyoxylase-like metal-dependent hydrolase (beta-lactamase superfamily II)